LFLYATVSAGASNPRDSLPPWKPQPAQTDESDSPTAKRPFNPRDIDVGNIQGYLSGLGSLHSLTYPVGESSIPRLKKVYYVGFCGIFIGGVKGFDTVVCGSGYYPNDVFYEIETPRKISSIRQMPFYDPSARHDLEISQALVDTTGWIGENIDEITGDTLPSLGIEVHQTILGARSGVLKRALIVDCWVINISDSPIEHLCFGVNLTPSIGSELISRYQMFMEGGPATGELCGFVPEVPGIVGGLADTINLAWIADNDGDAFWTKGKFVSYNPTAAVGVRMLSAPSGAATSFNWWNWMSGWGPQLQRNSASYPKDLGWPRSDRAFYRRMTNHEIDYDQIYTAIDMTPHGWSEPVPGPNTRRRLADGDPASEVMVSVGPYDAPLFPGDSVRFTYAIVMGDDFHTDPNHYANTFDYDHPGPYLNGLNFNNLISAAQCAGWFYDNPGIDTDGDGYAGEFFLFDCKDRDCDTIFLSGDGVPDFKGPLPPPPPPFTIETYPTRIIVRWTGAETEHARDRHARHPDWEGYRVYVADGDTANGWALLAQWDREDYVRYSYHEKRGLWLRNSHPHTPEEWRGILSDPGFDPLAHPSPSLASGYWDTAHDTLRTANGTIIDIVTSPRCSYFAPGEANHGNDYDDGGQSYRNRIQRVGTIDTVIDAQTVGYGVYEFTIDDLSQARPYWIAVTAFDYGDYRSFIDPEESAPAPTSVPSSPSTTCRRWWIPI
jgi:hypothetical protein